MVLLALVNSVTVVHCSVAKSYVTYCERMYCSIPEFPVFTISWSLLKLTSIDLMMSSNHLVLYRPLLLLPSIFPSIRVSSSESALRIRWPEYWSFSFSISPSNESSGLISFRIDWLDLLAVPGTLENLPASQFENISSLVLSFVYVLLSHPYMTTGKSIALTMWTFVSKVMFLIFNNTI